jgi:hypothetical protein
MAENTNILNPPKLDLSVDRYAAFKTWKVRWTDYTIITELRRKDADYQCAMLRYSFTEDTQKIYESLNLAETRDMDTIIGTIETFARGIVNETLERHNFNARDQQDGETFDDFSTDVKILSKNCNFCQDCHNSLVRDRIVAGIRDDSLRKKLLAEPKLTLKKAEDICRANETAQIGIETLKEDKSSNKATADAIQSSAGAEYQRNKTPFHKTRFQPTQEHPCKFCNRSHQRGTQSCPAWGRTCMACYKRNHFKGSSVCRKQVNFVNESTGAEEDVGALFIGSLKQRTKSPEDTSWEVEMPAAKGNILFKIDTCADVTVISQADLEKTTVTIADLKPTRKKLTGPTQQELKCLGYAYLTFQWGDKSSQEIVYVCKRLRKSLLGRPAIRRLDIAKMRMAESYSCGEVNITNNKFRQKFPDVFNGLGEITGDPIHIKIQSNATPYRITTPRHIPVRLFEAVKKELNRMLNLGVIK